MVSEGPAVSIILVTHCADVTASQLWAGTLSCSCKLTSSPSGSVQAEVQQNDPAYCYVSLIPCTHARNKKVNGVKRIGLIHMAAARQSKAHATHGHKVKSFQDSSLACSKTD